MTLVEAIGIVETMLQRSLWPDEITMLGRMIEAGKDSAEIISAFEDWDRPPEKSDDEVDVYRYEPLNMEQARRIE